MKKIVGAFAKDLIIQMIISIILLLLASFVVLKIGDFLEKNKAKNASICPCALSTLRKINIFRRYHQICERISIFFIKFAGNLNV